MSKIPTLTLFIFLVGCKSVSPVKDDQLWLSGKWETCGKSGSFSDYGTMQFNNSGKVNYIAGWYDLNGVATKIIKYEGQWKLKDNTLVIAVIRSNKPKKYPFGKLISKNIKIDDQNIFKFLFKDKTYEDWKRSGSQPDNCVQPTKLNPSSVSR